MEKDDPKGGPPKKPPPKKPPPPKSNIPTVVGVPALPDPRLEKKEEPKEEPKKKSNPPPPAAPPPTEPKIVEPDAPFEPALGSARANPIEIVKRKYRELVEGPRPRLIAFAVVGGLVLLIFVGVLVRLIFGSHANGDQAPSASASTSASAPVAITSVAPTASAPPPALPPKAIACSLGGSSHVIAPRAIVSVGIDAAPIDSSVALGFASAPKEASIALVDPATAGLTKISKIASQGSIVRVSPRSPIEKSWVTADANAMRPIGDWDVGAQKGALVLAKHGSPDSSELWKLESDAAVEALRGSPTSDGVVVAYRHAGAIWAGKGSGGQTSTPVRVAGLGPQVGSPAIALSGGSVMVAWADRAEASQPWGLRFFVWHLGEDAKPAQSFSVPGGGPGEHAMSPSIAALSNGFLLLWTEGPMDHQQVRAQVLRTDGTPSGDAILVSPAGTHAGQGQAAFLADGRGVVAFLADAGKAFELRASTMRCE